MKNLIRTTVLVCLGFAHALAQAALPPEKAAELGKTFTEFGAEKAGNAEGTIPAYTGGLPVDTKPAGFKPGSGTWADPFADEKPLFSISAKNLDEYADKLTEGQKALLKRYPDYRMDIYPTHRTASFPKYVLDNTLKYAQSANTPNGGVSLAGAYGGIPFPIPQTGYEAMWNHINKFRGYAYSIQATLNYVDANGRAILGGDIQMWSQAPYYDEKGDVEKFYAGGRTPYFETVYPFRNPARVAGDVTLIVDYPDPVANPRRSWSYSASTRRVRVAPDIAYDTPVGTLGGVLTYDDSELFYGKMDRFEFKLVGKKEIFVPYNSYKLVFGTDREQALTPKFLNPDIVRWELHRVYVVEATLKPGFRHVYSRRTYYLDEDKSGVGLADLYDASGKLYKSHHITAVQLYDLQRPYNMTYWSYDLATGAYALGMHPGTKGKYVPIDKLSSSFFSPDEMPSRSGR
jgi:hypothetical protein